MARYNFRNQAHKIYTLGSTSFNYLDKNYVFDEFQEDHNQYSEVILLVTGFEKLSLLGKNINDLIEGENRLREDLRIKIKGLVDFLRISEKITVTVD